MKMQKEQSQSKSAMKISYSILLNIAGAFGPRNPVLRKLAAILHVIALIGSSAA